MARTKSNATNASTATIGFEANARSARRDWATNSQGSGSQRDIRRALIEADLVDCMVALPGQLFMATEKFNVALVA